MAADLAALDPRNAELAELRSKNAKLREALGKCRDEHAAQAVAWASSGDSDQHAYHRKWQAVCDAELA